MQDFTIFDQPLPTGTSSNLHNQSDTTEPQDAPKSPDSVMPGGPVLGQRLKMIDNNRPKQNNDSAFKKPNDAPVAGGSNRPPKELSQDLVEYLNFSKELLDKTRTERNDLIARIDEIEDTITRARKEGDYDYARFEELTATKDELHNKSNLVKALIDIIRTLE